MNFDTKGQALDVVTDATTDKTERVSFCNLAEDTYMTDGTTCEKKMSDVQVAIGTKQNASTAINTTNIGNQSVNYANSAGSAESAASATNADTLDGKHASEFQTHNDTLDSVMANWDDVSDKALSALPSTGGTLTGDLSIQGNLNMNGRAIYDMTYIRGSAGREMDVMTHDNTQGVRLCGLFSESVDYNGSNYVDHRCNNLHYSGDLVKDSSRLVKENVKDMTDEEAQKLLELRAVNFDYKKGFGAKDQSGFIAEEVAKIIPMAVHIPEGFDEKNFDESKGNYRNEVPSIDYVFFVPLIIKQLQIQQKEINELKENNIELENRLSVLEDK